MLLDISRLTRRALFCFVRFPRWSGWKHVNRFLPGHPFVKRYLCRGHTVNSSTCFWLGAIKPPRLKRTSASPICVFPLCVFPLTPSADRWSNILFAHDFTGTIVISSFPGAGPQYESSEKKEQLILKMLSFFNIDSNGSVNSSCAQRPPGYYRAFACLACPGDGAFANFVLLRGRAFANHAAIPGLSFWHARGFLSEYNYTEDFTGKENRLAQRPCKGMFLILCMHFFIAYQARIT